MARLVSWDVERRADDVIIAVHPWRDGYAGDPETFAPVRDKMEIPLPTFAEQVQAIHLARMTANGGRIGPEANLPMLRTNADQLRAYYTDVGAYAPGVDPPAQPPPVADCDTEFLAPAVVTVLADRRRSAPYGLQCGADATPGDVQRLPHPRRRRLG